MNQSLPLQYAYMILVLLLAAAIITLIHTVLQDADI